MNGICVILASSSSAPSYCCVNGGCFASNQCAWSQDECTAQCAQSSSSASSVDECQGVDACGNGASDYCSATGLTCSDSTNLPCFVCTVPDCGGNGPCQTGQCCNGNQCEPVVGANGGVCDAWIKKECTGNECNEGGNAYCGAKNMTCTTISQLPCIRCISGPSSSSESSSETSAAACTGNECALGGDTYCQSLGQTCQDIPDLPCIQCLGPASSSEASSSGATCEGNECALGGDTYCQSIGKPTCQNISTLPCIQCLSGNTNGGTGGTGGGQCTGNECNQGGTAYCQSLGLSCIDTPDTSTCIQCVSTGESSSAFSRGPSGYCCVNGNIFTSPDCSLTQAQAQTYCSGSYSSGTYGYGSSAPASYRCTGTECNQGGSSFCASQNLTCIATSQTPCIACVPPTSSSSSAYQCTGTECNQGGSMFCESLDSTCSPLASSPCIQCLGPGNTPPVCPKTACALGGSDYCHTLGLDCTNDPASPSCIRCITPSLCGNGHLDPGEECDDGSQNGKDGLCDSSCHKLSGFCGDGTIETLLGEQCEPNLPSPFPGIACNGHCRFVLPRCGDGTIDPGEECDDGSKNSDAPGAHCRTDCRLARCGDGILDPSEQCDDGNNISGDGCSASCRLENAAPPPQVLPATVIQLPFSPSVPSASGTTLLCTDSSTCPKDTVCQSGHCTPLVFYGASHHAPVGKSGDTTTARGRCTGSCARAE